MPTPSEYRAALALITERATGELAELLRALRGKPDQQRAFLLELGPELIRYYADASSALAADSYDDERERAGATGLYVAAPVVLDRTVKIRRGIAWGSDPLFDGALDLSDIEDSDAFKRLARVVQTEVARPFRDTILENRTRDPQCVGWKRITHGGCGFCKMLAANGAVYRKETAVFAAHDHCGCSAAAVFLGGEIGPEATSFQYMASGRRKRSPHEQQQLRMWVEFYESQ